jgi:glycosyltransferase 2 family protein
VRSVEPRADSPRAPRRLLILGAVLVGLAVLVALVILADARTLLDTARGIPPSGLLGPLLFSFLSYAAMARSYQGIADLAGHRLPFPTWLRITFVSNTVNYVVTSAGLSGFAVRMFLLSKYGVPSGRAVLISLVQTFLTNFTLLFFILGGFVSLVVRQQLSGPALFVATAALAVFAGVLAYALVLVMNRRLRRLTLFWIGKLAHRLLRRFAPSRTPDLVRFWRYQHNLDRGIEFLLARKSGMVAPTAWITFDWVLTSGILWAAFRGVGHPLSPGMVMVGFGVGLFFSLVSFVPGGLGIMEGSMSAVFVSLGVPLEKAVVAVLIFRLTYHVLPLFVSMFLFRGVFRAAQRSLSTTLQRS